MPVVDLIKEYVTENPGSITLYLVLLMVSTILSIVGVTQATASMYEHTTRGSRLSAMRMLSLCCYCCNCCEDSCYWPPTSRCTLELLSSSDSLTSSFLFLHFFAMCCPLLPREKVRDSVTPSSR